MIDLAGVSKAYRRGGDEAPALHDVSLTVERGEMLGVVGESGSGKSTLLRLINHLEAPTAGSVHVDGEDLATLAPRARRRRRRRIGMVFQQFNLLANKTVAANVALPLSLQRRRDVDHVRRMLEFVGMAEHAASYPAQLSGGQQQRVAIARALATDPRILLCDEPTSALDDHHASEVMDTLAAVRRQLDTTIVLVSHELDVVQGSCDRAAILEGGRLAGVADVVAPPPARTFSSYAARVRHVLEGGADRRDPEPGELREAREAGGGREEGAA
ncbi:methionine ABC transporter ATP-binding protein [Nesterenkonia sp. F]|uniref:methionine ABC transporter ATP-binding protein n=1 Tax=Nesterenkonia sp. F TaxID=795955 RepID=UPI000255D269|nr:ATP-binding cassette domain-containing protein [Nesterenkonia sp. F]